MSISETVFTEPTPVVKTPSEPSRMEAAVIQNYGQAQQLQVRSIPQPIIDGEQVLIRVRAAGINPIDWRIRNGELRWILPTQFPFVPGFDVSGEIVQMGGRVKNAFKPGEEVFCFLDNTHGGGYAQYAAASASVVAPKPSQLSHVEAAAVPLAASTALQALRDLGDVRAGQDVLINGASGGVGTIAVQIAAAMGARVTGVCSGANVRLVRDLGADEVIDYDNYDFTATTRRFDVVFDAVGKSSYLACRRILTDNGRYLTTLPSLQTFIFCALARLNGRQCQLVIVRPRGPDLVQLSKMIDQGSLRPVVDKVFALNEATTAHNISEEGHVRGKLVLRVP